MFDKIENFFSSLSKQVQPILDFAKTKNLEEKLPRNYEKERIEISGLIYDVLTGKLLVREALLKFPTQLDDVSSTIAYHALVHYEADEELRKNDKLYAEEQDNYIIYIGETLQKGEALPKNLLDEYKKYYRWAPSKYSDSKENIIEKLKRYINI